MVWIVFTASVSIVPVFIGILLHYNPHHYSFPFTSLESLRVHEKTKEKATKERATPKIPHARNLQDLWSS